MVTVKASQKLFTHAEVARLTGLCSEHLSHAAQRFRLGFIARTSGTAATSPSDEWRFTPWDLNVLLVMFPGCTH